MSKSKLRIEAIKLRRNGRSVGEIMQILGISKSTSSHWCREVMLTEKQKKLLRYKSTLAGHKGRMIGAEMNHRKKLDSIEKNYKEASRLIGNLSNRDLLIAGASLYWGEGSKSDRTAGFVFVNSDPDMVLL